MLDYKTQADEKSLYNTPPCWSIYVAGLVFKQILREGGLDGMQQRNIHKANIIYDTIEVSAWQTMIHSKQNAMLYGQSKDHCWQCLAPMVLACVGILCR